MDSDDWLFPAPRRTPGDPAAYWPDTFFLELPEPPPGIEAVGEDGTITPEASEYFALAEHERTHWLQAHALAYGRFQTSLEIEKAEIAESFFLLFPAETIEYLIQSRLSVRAPFKVNTDYSLSKVDRMGPSAVKLQSHWWSLASLQYELESSKQVFASLESSRFRYGLGVLYARAADRISAVAGLSDDALREAALEFAPADEYSAALARSSFEWLSSTSIAECGAILNQHWMYSNNALLLERHGIADAGRLWAALVASLDSIKTTSYGDAFKVYQMLNPHADLNEPRARASLLIACSVALDGAFDRDEPSRATWLDVSPVCRFVALSTALQKVGVFPSPLVCDVDADEYARYVESWCDAAGIRAPLSAFALRAPAEPLEPSPLNDLRELSTETARASAAYQKAVPGSIIASAEAEMRRAPDLDALEPTAGRLPRFPPLVVLGSRACENKHHPLARYGVAGAYLRLMQALFARDRASPRDGLPACEAGRVILEGATRLASDRLGVKLAEY
jgi:hypothetical protein